MKGKWSLAVSVLMVLVLLFTFSGCEKAAPTPTPKPAPAVIATTVPGVTPTLPKPATPTPALPKLLVITSYDIGSGAYVFTASFADVFAKRTGIKVRVLPSGTDPGRIVPVKSGDAHMAVISGGTTYAANLGLYMEFCSYDTGPQQLQSVWQCSRRAIVDGERGDGTGMFARGDAGAKTPYDLKGKRVPFSSGAAALNLIISAIMAFGNVTWDDVKMTKFPGYGASLTGVKEGRADAGGGLSTAAAVYEIESTAGLVWLNMPADDKAGWERAKAVAPYILPKLSDTGAAISKEKPVWITSYSYPQFAVYPEANEDLVYLTTKTLAEGYNDYKNLNPVMKFWTLDDAVDFLDIPFPYHKGAVKYFKEVGKWTPAHEEWNNKLIKQQQDVKNLWGQFVDENLAKGTKAADLPRTWEKKLNEGLGIKVYPLPLQ